ncbi:hypothetical protein wCauATS_08570 [Wolbachia pipientis]|uniref:DUF6444 domain-containing protein n=1 Tax=Wolbachia endosymbiont of Sergentomyia squamirostris TaxID=3113640 RepID=A0AAT9GBM0_9RICK|nr:hypothetical protein wHma_00410 [Wolbachia pipientis]
MVNMSDLLASLLKLCESFKIEIEQLKAEIKRLEIENENFRSENKALRIENAELKERLGLNSQNSSIPSSKELYKLKKKKKKSDRKIGAQIGHEGKYRPKMEADEVVKIEFLRVRRRNCDIERAIHSSKS